MPYTLGQRSAIQHGLSIDDVDHRNSLCLLALVGLSSLLAIGVTGIGVCIITIGETTSNAKLGQRHPRPASGVPAAGLRGDVAFATRTFDLACNAGADDDGGLRFAIHASSWNPSCHQWTVCLRQVHDVDVASKTLRMKPTNPIARIRVGRDTSPTRPRLIPSPERL